MNIHDITNLSGKILIANPIIKYGSLFYKSLIYIISHTKEEVVGLVINHLVNNAPFKTLFKVIDNTHCFTSEIILPVYLGGPVDPARGFFLHSIDYDKNVLFRIKDSLAISSNLEMLKDIAAGIGPKRSLFAMGYLTWSFSKFEQELESNVWIISEFDEELIFTELGTQKWGLALKKLGVEIESYYSLSQALHC